MSGFELKPLLTDNEAIIYKILISNISRLSRLENIKLTYLHPKEHVLSNINIQFEIDIDIKKITPLFFFKYWHNTTHFVFKIEYTYLDREYEIFSFHSGSTIFAKNICFIPNYHYFLPLYREDWEKNFANDVQPPHNWGLKMYDISHFEHEWILIAHLLSIPPLSDLSILKGRIYNYRTRIRKYKVPKHPFKYRLNICFYSDTIEN